MRTITANRAGWKMIREAMTTPPPEQPKVIEYAAFRYGDLGAGERVLEPVAGVARVKVRER